MAARYGPHRYSAGEYGGEHTDEFRGARFVVRDFGGARFVDCDLSGAKIVDGWLTDVDISGYVSALRVNGIDVTDFVAAELDRRHPERVQLRELRDADGFRGMWRTIEGLWSQTLARAERLPQSRLHERVDGEWSFVETLRHLVFITDAWASRTVLDEPAPYHPLGLPQSWYAPTDAAALGIDVEARPSLADVLAARAERMTLVRGLVADLDDSELGRACLRSPAPGYPDEPRSVGECLGVVMQEECEHHRFAVRDLAVLEAG